MYTIYVDGHALYAPNLANEGYSVLNPKITMELNKAGSLEFTVPPNNLMYDNIHRMKSIIQVFDGGEEIFRGRVLHDEKDFAKRKAVYCEGELSFLLDSIQRTYDYSGTLSGLFTQYITNHNAQVDESKRFTVGQITVTDSNNYVHYSSTQYPNTWDEIKKKLIETHGGYVRTRVQGGVRYIDYIEDYDHIAPQTIEFGVNMLDISEHINADDVFTVLIPLGAKQGETETRLTVESVNDGKDYIEDADAIALFGRITKVNTWDNVTVATNLLNKGRSFLADGVQMSISLSLKAVDLHLVNVDTERIHLGDYIRVLSVPHRIDRRFQCSKITLDLVNPDASEYDFGVAFKSMTDDQVGTGIEGASLQEMVITAQKTANQAQQSANQANTEIETVITQLPTDYVGTATFEAFRTEVNSKLAVVYRVKGSVSTFNDLPLTNNHVGDVWNTLDTDANYVYTESGWDKLSETIDLTRFVTNTTFQALVDRVSALEGNGE